jgi:hypothetical protein
MKQNFITLAAATAIGLVMSASAHAGDSNTLYIATTGDNNVANIHQSGKNGGSAGGNDIGLDGAPILQNGDGNYFNYTNDWYKSGSDNDIVKLKQAGDNNWFRARDDWGSKGGRVFDVLQQGVNNQTMLLRTGELNSKVEALTMKGDNNSVYIRQGPDSAATTALGGSNTVKTVRIVGSNNGLTAGTSGAQPGTAGIRIEQGGSGVNGGYSNNIDEASIAGSDNRNIHVHGVAYPPASPWGGNAVSIKQIGSYNGIGASTAQMKGSGGENLIHITQDGNWNDFDMRQGLNASSVSNQITLLQTGDVNAATGTQRGDYNDMDIMQTGNWNGVQVDQQGNTNTASVLITGDGNGLGKSLPLLTSGLISQTGDDNGVLLTVAGDNNAFGFRQKGDGNSIDAIQDGDWNKVEGSQIGDQNQAVVSQAGSLNVASFVQNGSFNVVGISQ